MYILWIMLVYLLLYLAIVIMGPSIWDRLLGMNLVSTKIIIIIIVLASVYNTAYILDFAVIYTLFGFIGVIFTALFLFERTRGREE